MVIFNSYVKFPEGILIESLRSHHVQQEFDAAFFGIAEPEARSMDTHPEVADRDRVRGLPVVAAPSIDSFYINWLK